MELKFQIKGHTRNSVDRGFGYTKIEYVSSEVYSLDDFKKVIARSAFHSRTGLSKCISFKIENTSEIFKTFTEYYESKYKKSKMFNHTEFLNVIMKIWILYSVCRAEI